MPISPIQLSTSQAPSTPPRPAASEKLASAAKDFESILLGQWLQSAETSFGSVPGADDDQDNGDEQMKSFGVQQLAKSLSESGGIGIADMISKTLARAGTDTTTPGEHLQTGVSR